MTVIIDGTSGVTTPGVVNTAAQTIATTLAVTGVTTIAAGSAAAPALVGATGGATTGVWFPAASTVAFANAGVESARIDSSGNLLVGTTSQINGSSIFKCGSGLDVYRPTATAGNAIQYWYSDNTGTASLRGYIAANGGLYNYSANNSNLSDERTKTDIQNAGSYLYKICAIPVRTFKYKNQTDELLNLGVIAQEVETVAPELVNVEGFGETPEDGVPLKAIYQTDLQYALMKCIQEQQTLITALTARITALEAQIV